MSNEEKRFREILLHGADTHGVSMNVHQWAAECGFLKPGGRWELPSSDSMIAWKIDQVAEYFRERGD